MLSLSRKLMAACLLVAGMATAGFAQTAAESKPVTSQEGHFHVVFPGEPQIDSKDGIQIMTYKPEGSGMGYIAMYTEIPAEVLKALNDERTSDQDRLDAFAKGSVAGMNAKVTAERTSKSADVTGKEVCFDMPDGSSGVFRCYISGGRLYLVTVVWKGVAPASTDVSQFLDSFILDS